MSAIGGNNKLHECMAGRRRSVLLFRMRMKLLRLREIPLLRLEARLLRLGCLISPVGFGITPIECIEYAKIDFDSK